MKRITFRRKESHCIKDGQDIVPVDAETGEDIAGVISCTVSSRLQSLTTMQIELQVLPDDALPEE